MADAKSLLHQDLRKFSSHSVDIDNTASQETHMTCLWTLARFEDNGRSTCLHCSSDEGNTHLQPRGFTW